MNKHILITGGAGFIGANFAHFFHSKYQDFHITVLDRLTYAGNLKNLVDLEKSDRFTFVRADIANQAELHQVLEKGNYSHVAHFAAESHVDRSILGPEEFVRTNVNGTFNILESLRKLGWAENPQGRRMLHVSTDEVFGTLGETGEFSEETCYAPNSPYSSSKAASDHLVRAYYHTYGLPVVTSNCSNNYGPYQFPEKLIPLMTLNALRGKELPVYGEGKNIRDWLHVEDHCTALDAVLMNGREGETYNVGTRNERTNIEIVHRICEIMDELHPEGKPHANLIRHVKDRPGHDFRYAINPDKIQSELGWKPRHSFESGLRETIEWYLENRSWWEEILSGDYRNYYDQQYTGR